jgi:hypothetical protein
MNDFTSKYPSALFLRDEHNRLLHHVALSSGINMRTDALLISHISDEKLVEKDPVSDLYPFVIAASGERSDLYTVYHLLGRNPSILDNDHRRDIGNRRRRKEKNKE